MDASYRVIGGSVRVTLALTTIHQLIINGAPYHRAPGFLCSEVRGDERSTCASNDTGNDEKCHEKSTNAVTSSKLTNNFMASSLCLKLSLRIFYFLVFHWNPLNLKGIPKAIAQPSKLSSQGNNLLKVALSPNVTSFPDLLWQKNVLSCFFSSNKWCKWKNTLISGKGN